MKYKLKGIRFLGRIPLQAILIIPFVIQVVLIVGITGYLSFRNGEQAVNSLVVGLQDEVAHRIEERLHQYLTLPHLLNQVEGAAIETGQLDITDESALLTFFWQSLRSFPELNATFLGTEEGVMVGVRHPTGRGLEVILSSATTAHSLNYYTADDKGQPGELVETAPDYDPRQRSWYVDALKIGHSHWSPIYLDFATEMPVITAGMPVHNGGGELVGVVGSAFQFEQVNAFLRDLDISEHGQTFIMERNGLLVSSSSAAPISRQTEGGVVRLQAVESEDLVERETAVFLQNKFSSLHAIQENQNLIIPINNVDYYVHLTPITDAHGLDWLVAIIIPTTDFMAEIQANNRLTLQAILLALLASTLIGMLTARWVIRPLIILRNSALAFSRGDWQVRVPVHREGELGQLAQAFNQMAEQLQNAFTTMEHRVTERTEELAQARDALEMRVQQRTAELTAANQALQQSQARYESMFDYVPIMLWEEDFSPVKQLITGLQQQGITDFNAYFTAHPEIVIQCVSSVRIIAVNQTTVDILKADKETIMAHLDRFFGESAYDAFQKELVALSQGHTHFHSESDALAADGRQFRIQLRLAIVPGHEHDWSRVLVSVEDISYRHEIEEALRRSEKRLKQAQRMAQLGNWEVDLTTQTTSWSEEIYHILEIPLGTPPPALAQHIAYYLPEDQPKFQALMQSVIEAKQEMADTYRVQLPSGKIIHLVVTIFPMFDENGRMTKLSGTIQDITDRVLLEKQVQEQERLAAVGQLAAGIAHDFNNILSSMTLYTDLLLRTLPDLSPQNRKRLEVLARQEERAAQLIQQILDFSRRSPLVRRPTNILQSLQELAEILERTLPDNILVEFNHDALAYMADIDPTRIQQVFMNLAVNARDAMPAGGNLIISVTDRYFHNHDKLPMADMPAGEWIEIQVSDNGIGIPEEDLPRLFEPFFTTKEPGKGTGLGLAQVYGIITQHNGFILIESQVQVGTTFTIYLPMISEWDEAHQAWQVEEAEKGHGETILVVEDNESTREAVVAALEMLNYQTLTAVNGRQALTILQQPPAPIHIVLSDMLMPEMSGLQMVAAMQKHNIHLPVIILSGHILEEDLEKMHQLNISSWLHKPPNLKELATMLKQIL
ncbi:MAG: response regulator [Ardenticatenaceae bacterium]|nr:response regulator [Ardenticatenaceae bacterium]